MEAALAVQGKQWQDTMTSMKESRSKYETEIHNLTLENTRLSAEVSVLTHELSSSKNQISAMESENEISEEMLQRVMKEVESLKTELESTREAKAGAKRLAGQIQVSSSFLLGCFFKVVIMLCLCKVSQKYLKSCLMPVDLCIIF